MKLRLEKEIQTHADQLEQLSVSPDENKEEIENLKQAIEAKKAELAEFDTEVLEEAISDIDEHSSLSGKVKKEVKGELNVAEEEKSIEKEAEEIKNNIETKEDPFTQKYKKEILPIIEILKPDDAQLEEYEQQVVDDLFESVKRQQVARGTLMEDPSKTLDEVKNLLNERIHALLDTARDYTRKDKLDENIVKKAKIALLSQRDLYDWRKQYDRFDDQKKPEDVDYSDKLVDYYLDARKHSDDHDNRLTSIEVNALINGGLGSVLVGISSYDYGRRIKETPDALLQLLVHEREKNDNVSTALKYSSIPEGYSKETVKVFKDNGEGYVVLKYLSSFEKSIDVVDFESLIKAYSPEYPYHTADILNCINNTGLTVEQKSHFAEIVLKYQKVQKRELDDMPVFIKEKCVKMYNEIEFITTGKSIGKVGKYSWNDINPEELPGEEIEKLKKYITDGYITFFYEHNEYIKYFVKNDYEWLRDQVITHNQENLLFSGSGTANFLKPEDQNIYAQKLINQNNIHTLKALVEKGGFSEGALPDNVYTKLLEHGYTTELKTFANLSEESFAKTLEKPGNLLVGDNLFQNIRKFDLKSTGKFIEYKEYKDFVEFIEDQFGLKNNKELYLDLGLQFSDIRDKGFENAKKEISEKVEILKKNLPANCVSKFTERPDLAWSDSMTTFQYLYGFKLLEENTTDLEKMLKATKFLKPEIMAKKSLSIEILRTIKDRNEDKSTEVTGELNILSQIFSTSNNEEFFRRYLSLVGGNTTDTLATYEKTDIIPEYVLKYKTLDDEKKKLFQKVFPWSESLQKIEGIQKQVKRAEYDPWKTQFMPLLRSHLETRDMDGNRRISLANPEDGEMFFDYFQRFGMKNLPLTFSLFSQIYKSKHADLIPPLVEVELLKTFNINVHELCKKDKTNIGLVLSELEKVLPKMIGDVRTENPAFIKSVTESPYAMDLFKSIVGDSGHSHGTTPENALKIYSESLVKNPEKFKVPKEYTEVSISIPELVIEEGEKEEKIEQEKNKILNNPELNQILSEYKEVVEEATSGEVFANFPRVMREEINKNIPNFFIDAVSELEKRLDVEQKMETPNTKAIFGLKKRIEEFRNKESLFKEKSEEVYDNQKLVTIMEIISSTVPDEYVGKKKFLMKLSMGDMSEKIKEGYDAVISAGMNKDADLSVSVSKYNEFIGNHVKEHYLNKKHGLESAIETNDKNLIKALKKYWGTQDFEKSILAVSAEKLKILEKGEMSNKIKQISLIPSKGLQRIFSGDIGKACTSRQNQLLAKGEFEEIISYSLVLDKETKNERFAGSFLVIETEDSNKEKTMVLRANNPQQNLFNMIDGDSLIKSILDEVKEVAKRRGINKVVVPLSGGATSNRTEISAYYNKFFGKNEKIQLKNSTETNFNGYDIWNKDSSNAVVKI